MKKILLVVILVILPLASQAMGAENPATTTAPKSKTEMRADKLKQECRSLATKLANAFNLRLASSGKGILLSDKTFLTGSSKKVKVVWMQSQAKELVLEVDKSGTASVGYTINF